jgi:hypothetical protein
MENSKKIKSAREQALKDIAQYIKEEAESLDNGDPTRSIINTVHLNTKLNRYLNRLLKINTVNYGKKK